MENIEIISIIENLVEAKAASLSTWKPVRWEGGRLYYETTKISNEINEYAIDIQISYLEKLLQSSFVIQDNWPSSAPDITDDFKNWLVSKISNLKILKFQSNKASITTNRGFSQKKKRPQIPTKTRALLQKEINSSCPLCINEDVDHFQIHHIDENPENNQFDNLLMLCPNCHSKITKNDISKEEVMKIKIELSKKI